MWSTIHQTIGNMWRGSLKHGKAPHVILDSTYKDIIVKDLNVNVPSQIIPDQELYESYYLVPESAIEKAPSDIIGLLNIKDFAYSYEDILLFLSKRCLSNESEFLYKQTDYQMYYTHYDTVIGSPKQPTGSLIVIDDDYILSRKSQIDPERHITRDDITNLLKKRGTIRTDFGGFSATDRNLIVIEGEDYIDSGDRYLFATESGLLIQKEMGSCITTITMDKKKAKSVIRSRKATRKNRTIGDLEPNDFPTIGMICSLMTMLKHSIVSYMMNKVAVRNYTTPSLKSFTETVDVAEYMAESLQILDKDFLMGDESSNHLVSAMKKLMNTKILEKIQHDVKRLSNRIEKPSSKDNRIEKIEQLKDQLNERLEAYKAYENLYSVIEKILLSGRKKLQKEDAQWELPLYQELN